LQQKCKICCRNSHQNCYHRGSLYQEPMFLIYCIAVTHMIQIYLEFWSWCANKLPYLFYDRQPSQVHCCIEFFRTGSQPMEKLRSSENSGANLNCPCIFVKIFKMFVTICELQCFHLFSSVMFLLSLLNQQTYIYIIAAMRTTSLAY
jgi:hypothetical protein